MLYVDLESNQLLRQLTRVPPGLVCIRTGVVASSWSISWAGRRMPVGAKLVTVGSPGQRSGGCLQCCRLLAAAGHHVPDGDRPGPSAVAGGLPTTAACTCVAVPPSSSNVRRFSGSASVTRWAGVQRLQTCSTSWDRTLWVEPAMDSVCLAPCRRWCHNRCPAATCGGSAASVNEPAAAVLLAASGSA